MSTKQSKQLSPKFRLLHGDSAELLYSIFDNSVDALITDPPAGIAFMGKKWDTDRGGRDAWIEWFSGIMKLSLKTLRPGAHGLVWALPRTCHWTATALEDAGFEIRDIITHHYGSGFPKSHNVGLSIDKLKGHKDRGHRIATASKVHPDGTPEPAGEFVEPYKAKTPEGEQWSGWGTALKPASEHWILVRKPLAESSIARNVLEHGTGAINIDECRTGTMPKSMEGQVRRRNDKSAWNPSKGMFTPGREHIPPPPNDRGRYPANLLLTHSASCTDTCADDCPVGEMDRQSGYTSDGKIPHNASRYFTQFRYEPKASQSERHETGQNSHPTIKPINLMAWLCRLITSDYGLILDPFAGSGSTGVAAIRSGFHFIGIEQEKEYYDIALKRLEHETEGVLF